MAIPENVEVGSAVLDIQAESMTGKKIIYSISAGNIYGEFDIVFDLGQSRSRSFGHVHSEFTSWSLLRSAGDIFIWHFRSFSLIFVLLRAIHTICKEA